MANALPSVIEFLERFHATPAKIWAEDPESNTEKVAGGFITKTYLTYRILLKYVGRDVVGVRHRFSEFESMRIELKDCYSQYGILVPSMPPKRLVGGNDEAFVKERTQGLSLFCQAIVSSPWLRNDKAWSDFLRSSGSIDIASDNSMSVGESMLLCSFAQLEPPANPYARIVEIKEELSILEKKLNAVNTCARAMVDALVAMEKATRDVSTALYDWAGTEAVHCKVISGDSPHTDALLREPYKVKSSLKSLSEYMTKMADANVDSPHATGVLFISYIEHELSRIESFKELFKAHDEISSAIDSLAIKECKLRNGPDTKRELPEISKQLMAKRVLLAMFYKGFFHYSLPMNIRQRAIQMRKCASFLAGLNYVMGYDSHRLAANLVRDLCVAAEEAVTGASDVLELLKIRKLQYSLAPISAEMDESNILPDTLSATRDLFNEALSKNSGKSQVSTPAPSAPEPNQPISRTTSSTTQNPYSASPSYSPKPEVTKTVSNTPTVTAPVSVPPAPAVTSPSSSNAARGSLPTLLGRRRDSSSSNVTATPPPAPVVSSPAQPEKQEFSGNGSFMEASEEEVVVTSSVPVREASPVVEAPQPIKQTAKTRSLLDDLMGESNFGSGNKSTTSTTSSKYDDLFS